MALEKKIIGLPMAKGQNEKVSEKVLPVGQFEEAKNVQFVKAGEARKRKGFHSISNTVPALSTGDSASPRMATSPRRFRNSTKFIR